MADVSDRHFPLFDVAPDPTFLVSVESGEVAVANDRASELLGYDLSTLEGMPLADLHPAGSEDAYGRLLERTIDHEEIRADTLDTGEQICLETRRGDHIPIELHARMIEIEGERWLYSVARDITERKQRESELRRQRDRLETFAEIVSHDLRNPLNVAQARLDLLEDECESEHIEPIEASLDRIEALIADTLALARQGDALTETEPVDLGALL